MPPVGPAIPLTDTQPLPLACKTAWAYLLARQRADHQPSAPDPLRAAQAVFEGGFQRRGERDESAYLARAFASFADLADAMPGWAEQLYGDLARHLQLKPAQDTAA